MNTLTEEEAKTKWCPMYRVATSGGDPSGTYEIDNRQRDGIPPPDGSAKDAPWTPGPKFSPWVTCVGSGCMAWRWALPQLKKEWETGEAPFRERGYCGLAGKP